MTVPSAPTSPWSRARVEKQTIQPALHVSRGKSPGKRLYPAQAPLEFAHKGQSDLGNAAGHSQELLSRKQEQYAGLGRDQAVSGQALSGSTTPSTRTLPAANVSRVSSREPSVLRTAQMQPRTTNAAAPSQRPSSTTCCFGPIGANGRAPGELSKRGSREPAKTSLNCAARPRLDRRPRREGERLCLSPKARWRVHATSGNAPRVPTRMGQVGHSFPRLSPRFPGAMCAKIRCDRDIGAADVSCSASVNPQAGKRITC